LVSLSTMQNWIATIDANLTFVGDPDQIFSLFATTVTYCSIRVGGLCSGPCTVYTGAADYEGTKMARTRAAACLGTPDTVCLTATRNGAFCGSAGCHRTCSLLSTCGTRLEHNVCYAPGTQSISVP
ncbi:hypothetical protein C8R44DRAFT_595034, partial [Mycena epipterygia]